MFIGIIRQLWCAIKWAVYGDNYCVAARGRTIYEMGKAIGALFRRLFMNLASSAIGTGTVLGLHGVMAPEEASIQGSDLRDATVDESRNLMKINMDGSTSYFMIALVILICLLVVMTVPMCCGCSPSRLAKKRREERWKAEVRELMEQRNKEDAEMGMEAEGWQEINRSKT